MTQQLERTLNEARPVDPRLQPEVGQGNVRHLFIGLALIAALSMLLNIGGAVLVITLLLLMIMAHEYGHFITARWAGMRVTDFFVGFGPTIWSIKRGETRYGVKALPLGGFVRVIGMNNLEEVAPEDEPYTYRVKSYWQRLRFASAGSFMHFVMAFVLMVVLLAGFGIVDPNPDHDINKVDQVTRRIDGVTSPAYAAGLRDGDLIVGIDGKPIKMWSDLAGNIQGALGEALPVTIERDGERFTVPVTPIDGRTAEMKANGTDPFGIIGIRSTPNVVKTPLPRAFWAAGFELKDLTLDSANALRGLFTSESIKSYGKQLGKTGPADVEEDGNRLLSPVGIGRLADASAEAGAAAVLTLLIAINVFVGIFNMLPLPPFDGGHVAVATYEAVMSKIKGRRHMIDMAKLLPVAYMVIIALFLLSASALWLDIVHPFDLG